MNQSYSHPPGKSCPNPIFLLKRDSCRFMTDLTFFQIRYVAFHPTFTAKQLTIFLQKKSLTTIVFTNTEKTHGNMRSINIYSHKHSGMCVMLCFLGVPGHLGAAVFTHESYVGRFNILKRKITAKKENENQK